MLRMQLAECVELHKASEDVPTELELDPEEVIDWKDGVEHLKNKTADELYDILGFKDQKIPFLVSEIDVEGDIGVDARADEDKNSEDVAPSRQAVAKQRFSLKWHQLVGVTKMVERARTSGPVMLMDDVGLGKTLQVLAFFAVIAYYRKFHSEMGHYPGIWGEYWTRRDDCILRQERTGKEEWTNFAGEKATLPEYPFLFVVPPTLVDQVASECARFLASGSFDVITYFGGRTAHKKVWEVLKDRSHNLPYMRIYVASTTVSRWG